MSIGTSHGAFHEDEFRMEAHPWFIDPKMEGIDDNVVTPNKQFENKQLDNVETNPATGMGIEVSDKVIDDDQKNLTHWFNTQLDPAQQKSYDSKFPLGSNYDYDMQGWHSVNPDASPNQPGVHYPDTFKKPNHPTFSDESMYHQPEMSERDKARGVPPGMAFTSEGGHWDKNDDGSYNFTPGRTNLEYHSTQELIDYFKKNEPGNKLILPGQ